MIASIVYKNGEREELTGRMVSIYPQKAKNSPSIVVVQPTVEELDKGACGAYRNLKDIVMITVRDK